MIIEMAYHLFKRSILYDGSRDLSLFATTENNETGISIVDPKNLQQFYNHSLFNCTFGSHCFSNLHENPFIGFFQFSFETQTTIGYGSRIIHLSCYPAVLVSWFQTIIVSVLMQPILGGLIFRKLLRPLEDKQAASNKEYMKIVYKKLDRFGASLKNGGQSDYHYLNTWRRGGLANNSLCLSGEPPTRIDALNQKFKRNQTCVGVYATEISHLPDGEIAPTGLTSGSRPAGHLSNFGSPRSVSSSNYNINNIITSLNVLEEKMNKIDSLNRTDLTRNFTQQQEICNSPMIDRINSILSRTLDDGFEVCHSRKSSLPVALDSAVELNSNLSHYDNVSLS